MRKSIVRPMTPDEAEEALRGIGHKIVYDLDRFPPLHERVKALNLAANTMEWTTEKPTEAGLYWAYNGQDIVLVTKESDDRWVRFAYDPKDFMHNEIFFDDEYLYFIGPLPVPEPPKEPA